MKLTPQHSSTINPAVRPKDLQSMRIHPDARKFVEQEALSIFAAMTNAGASLQQTLSAVFLSGMSAGREAR